MACADLTREDTGLVGRSAHGACVTVDRAAAVGHGGTACAIALHNALVAVALGDAGNVDLVAGSEGVSLNFVADVQGLL